MRLGKTVDRWLLPIYVLFVVLYLILPVIVMIVVQLQRPDRAIQPDLAGVQHRRLAASARAAGPARGRVQQHPHRVRGDDHLDDPRDADRAGPRALPVPRSLRHEPAHLPADVDARDRAGRVPADDLHRLDGPRLHPGGRRVPDEHPDDHPGPHHVLHQLRGRDREGPPVGLPAPPRGSGDGPRARTSGSRSGR